MANAEKPVIVYALSDPSQPTVIRYIGATSQPLRRRYSGHLTARKNKSRTEWIKSLLVIGKKPMMWPIEICTEGNWEERENYWIELFRPLGHLMNRVPGIGRKWTDDERRRISEQRRGRKPTPAQQRHLDELHRARKGQKASPATIEKMRQINRDKRVSKIVPPKIKKIRAPRSKDVTEKIRLAQKGKLRPHVIMPGGKQVRCVETGVVFPSIWRAAQSVNAPCGKIRRSIRKGYSTRGVHWQFV